MFLFARQLISDLKLGTGFKKKKKTKGKQNPGLHGVWSEGIMVGK